jgi:hypothetical protein
LDHDVGSLGAFYAHLRHSNTILIDATFLPCNACYDSTLMALFPSPRRIVMSTRTHPNGFSLKGLSCSLLLTFGIACAAHAEVPGQANLPAYDLGQPFPHAADRSLSALWRVYVFEREGVRYFQINDAVGHVRATFAAEDGHFLVLPGGDDTDRVVVPQPLLGRMEACGGGCSVNQIIMSAHPGAIAAGDVIYQDTNLQIIATENAQQQPAWQVVALPSQAPSP